MPRSYRFEHYKVPKKETHLVYEEEKKEYVETRPAQGEPKIHYGKAHAQTEERASARRMNAELEELAARDAREARAKEASAEARVLEIRSGKRAIPIGGLPAPQESPLLRDDAALPDILDAARGQVRLVRLAARDLIRASLRLAGLPVRIAAIAARRLREREAERRWS